MDKYSWWMKYLWRPKEGVRFHWSWGHSCFCTNTWVLWSKLRFSSRVFDSLNRNYLYTKPDYFSILKVNCIFLLLCITWHWLKIEIYAWEINLFSQQKNQCNYRGLKENPQNLYSVFIGKMKKINLENNELSSLPWFWFHRKSDMGNITDLAVILSLKSKRQHKQTKQ